MALPALVEVRYRADQMADPGRLTSVEDVDRLIDELLDGSAYENLAQLTHLARGIVKPRVPGHDFPAVPDHDFQVGVDREQDVGVLLFIDGSGNFVTAGPPESRNAPAYYLAGHWTEFRDQVEVPVDLVRAAVKEFLLTGGRRPSCVAWKNQYEADDQEPAP
ncbi:Imm1 family immunity protein [Kitasatospora sp. NPDC059146]|uniref:Imm1 family immunity protein n=1 Tax=Kitasatospora sp. NPDC059146 TaxID=3346741 RepID=UPI00367A7CF6